VELITPHRKRNNFVVKCYTGPRTWADSLNKRHKLRKIWILQKLDGVVSTGLVWLRIGTIGGLL
jgi:hypothetical protein